MKRERTWLSMQLNEGYNELISHLFHTPRKKKKHSRFRKCLI